MTIAIEQEVAVSGPAPEQASNPHIGENQPPHDGSCANERCKKGPNGTQYSDQSRSRPDAVGDYRCRTAGI